MSESIPILRSSLGQKILMGATGLFLCLFLVEHLVGNLLLFIHDEGKTFEAYSDFMSHNFIVRTIEIGLFAGFLAHIIGGVRLWISNRASRPRKYRFNDSSANSRLPARIAFLTGSMVFIFLAVHLNTFFIPSRFGDGKSSMYTLVKTAFQSPGYVSFYLVALVLLGYHLRHGFQSAFQTFGLRTEKCGKMIDRLGMIFWLIIPLGYATMPIYFFWAHLTEVQ